MKCPKCSNNQRAREGKKCTKCGYEHVLTKKEDSITDAQFAAVLRGASAGDTLYFTFDQLYARYCRGRSGMVAAVVETVVHTMGRWGCGVMIVTGTIAVFAFLNDKTLIGIFAVAVFGLGFILNRIGRENIERVPSHRAPADVYKLRQYIEKWQAAGRPIPRLLRTPSLGEPPSGYREADLFDYGVERIVIVEREILVDWFVRNGVHAEQRALVLAESGYPRYLLPHAERLLEQRPDLPVVLLHDSTAHGLKMAERVRASGILPLAGRKLIDAGLSPRQVKGIKALDAVVPESTGYAVPVDMVPFPALVTGLFGVAALSMYGAALVHHPEKPPVDTGGSSGGDGVADFGEGEGGGDGDFG
jgi:hypothetical protein